MDTDKDFLYTSGFLTSYPKLLCPFILQRVEYVLSKRRVCEEKEGLFLRAAGLPCQGEDAVLVLAQCIIVLAQYEGRCAAVTHGHASHTHTCT